MKKCGICTEPDRFGKQSVSKKPQQVNPNNGKSPDTAVKEASFAPAGKESFQFSSHPWRNSADQNHRKQQGRGGAGRSIPLEW